MISVSKATAPALEVNLGTLVDVLGLTEARIGQLAREKVVVKLARGRYDLAATVKNYLTFLRKGVKGEGDDLPALRAELLRQQIGKAKRENEVAQGTYVAMTEVEDYLRRRAQRFDLMLTWILEQELPPRLRGLEIAAIRAAMRDAHDRIREQWNSGLKEWERAPEAFSDAGLATSTAAPEAP